MNFTLISQRPEYSVENLGKDSYERGVIDGIEKVIKEMIPGFFENGRDWDEDSILDQLMREQTENTLQALIDWIESDKATLQVAFVEQNMN